MGWLTDVGNIAVGAIERDREITKEDLAIRAENLQANKQILINQKDAKYKKELDAYYKEKEKFDEVEKNNALKAEGNISNRNYAVFALNHSNPYFKNLSDTEQTTQINKYIQDGNKTIDFKITGSPEEINAKAAEAMTLINNQTSKEIKDAKGNSFLINQILNRKEKAEKDIYKAIESKLKAIDAIKMTETSVNPDNVGLEIKGTASNNMSALMSKFVTETNSDKYQSEWSEQRDKINYNPLKDEQGIKFLNTSANLGGSDELTFKYNATDQKISGLNSPAFTFADSMKYFFNGVKDSNDTMVQHYYSVTPLHGNISKTWNEENIYSQVESIIEPRSGNIKEDPFGGGGKIRLTTIVPLSIVGLDTNANKASLKTINNIMNEYIIKETKERYTKEKKNKTYQQIANNVYSEIYRGTNKDAINSILNSYNEVVEKSQNKNNNIKVDTNTTIQDNKPVDTKTIISNNIVADVGIKSEDGKSILTWEKIEETNQIDGLNTEEKAAYNIWKSKQPTDIKLSGNESS